MFTKGEWRIGEFRPHSNKIVYIQLGTELWERERIADCYENEANAQLIALAPRMYEWIQEELEFLSDLMGKAQTEEEIAQIQGEIYGAEEVIRKVDKGD